jgi:hypothetical protein
MSTAPLTSIGSASAVALAPLLGQRLRRVGRSGLVWFSFGESREVRASGGGARIVGRYALHLQCPFRLRDADAVLLAAADRYAARQNPESSDASYDFDPIGASWFDVRAESLNELLERGAVKVLTVDADAVGGFRLVLEQSLVLDVLPDTSYPREHWRVFETGGQGFHFVLFDQGPDRPAH